MIKGILLTLLVTAVMLFVAVLAMSFKVLFVKGGKFPNIHIGGNKEMKKRGITCVTSQDREARKNINNNI